MALMMLALGCASKRSEAPVAGCPDIAATGQLNLLTLNMLYDAPASIRQKAWNDIAAFAVSNKVHLLLLQEAVLSDVDRIQQLLGTSDSARDLQRVLNERSPEPYELTVAWETGVPLVLTTANAILSRCNVSRHFTAFLPVESEEAFEGIDLKITRNVQVAQVTLPGYGTLHVYNTHLCAACSAESLQRQVQAMLDLVGQVEDRSAGTHLVLGGDLNIDLAKDASVQAVYDRITQAGWRDLYAEYRKAQAGDAPETLCRRGKADLHCTDGVSPVQGLIAQRTGAPFAPPARIDYLFGRGSNSVRQSRVLFNPGNTGTGPIVPTEPAVSDHSGLYTEILLKK
jgi:maltose 6'-phosphate phosphatase